MIGLSCRVQCGHPLHITRYLCMFEELTSKHKTQRALFMVRNNQRHGEVKLSSFLLAFQSNTRTALILSILERAVLFILFTLRLRNVLMSHASHSKEGRDFMK